MYQFLENFNVAKKVRGGIVIIRNWDFLVSIRDIIIKLNKKVNVSFCSKDFVLKEENGLFLMKFLIRGK